MLTHHDLSLIPLLSCLSEEYLDSLVQRGAEVILNPGDFLFHEGEVAAFYLLLEGTVELQKQILRKTHTLNAYHTGDFFGEVPLLLGSLTFASIRAKTSARVLRLDSQVFREIIRHSEECNGIVLKALLERVRLLYRAVSDAQPLEVLVVGDGQSSACREIGRFLRAVRTPYRVLSGSAPGISALDPALHLPGPAVIVDHQIVLDRPGTRALANALSLPVKPRQDTYDVAIVGAGPAGLAAAVYGASEGLKVLVIDRDAPGGQAGTSSRIENYLGFPGGISGDQLSERAIKQASRLGAEIVVTRQVRALEPADGRFLLCLDDSERVQANAVILANGIDWRRMSDPGLEPFLGRGISYGSDMSQAQAVKGCPVFIVGGGNSAGQAAMFFSNYAARITLLVRGPSLNSSMSQYLIDQIARVRNIAVETGTEVKEAGGHGNLEWIDTLRSGGLPQRRPANSLFIMIGAEPRTQWLPSTIARNREGYVLTGNKNDDWLLSRDPLSLETSLPGVFAAGDVRCGSIKRVAAAVGEGSTAISLVHQYLGTIR